MGDYFFTVQKKTARRCTFMCGICGIWGDADSELLDKMTRNMSHRGPDARGYYRSKKGELGHTRLSIMDPTQGDQPIYNETGDMAVIANGEIYNFPQLYRQLSPKHDFKTKSDTECLLHFYEEKGTDMVAELDGMFAFAITDGKDIFLARDPIGIKPLYYVSDEKNNLYFASEQKALIEISSDIHEFPAGHWYHSQKGMNCYYDVPEKEPVKDEVEFYTTRIRNTLESSVRKRLMSDVPLGVFLSGGLDSSILASITSRYVSPLHSFATGTEDSADILAARKVAEYLGTIHHEYLLTEEKIFDALPDVIYSLESFDQDLVRNGLPCYFTSKIAAEHVKVVLTGEGADELFCGYNYYRDINDRGELHKELRRSIQNLHNINLQRVDRMTMAHSIEGRVPFLDEEMINLAQEVPAEYKLDPANNIEKWILRKAFEGYLPYEILWRTKSQFTQGSGTVDTINGMVGKYFPEKYVEDYRKENSHLQLRSAEECLYHKIYREVFPNAAEMEGTVGRWELSKPELAS